MLAIMLISALTRVPSSGIGIGIVVGDPTGLSLKFWGIGQNSALQLHVGSGEIISGADLLVSGSLLFHAVLSRETPINGYLGVGGFFGVKGGRNQDVVAGIIIPLGLDFIFTEIPLDLFIEIPPAIGFSSDGVRAGLQFGVGLRYTIK